MKIMVPANINDIVNDFTERVQDAANRTLGMTSGKPITRKQSCWWSPACSKAVAERRYARRQLEKYPTRQNIENYKIKSAAAKKNCNESKLNSFNKFIEDLEYDTHTGIM